MSSVTWSSTNAARSCCSRADRAAGEVLGRDRLQRELLRLDQDVHRPRLFTAIVDRLTFGGTIIETGTASYRLAHTLAHRSANGQLPQYCSHMNRCAGDAVVSDLDACGLRMIDPGKVAQVRASMPAEGDVADLAEVFALLGDPGRLRLLTSLLEGGELCVCDLAASTGMSESAVSHALRLLRARRVVSVSRRGRMAYYRLDDAHVRMLLDLGLTHTAHTSAINTAHTSAINTAGQRP